MTFQEGFILSACKYYELTAKIKSLDTRVSLEKTARSGNTGPNNPHGNNPLLSGWGFQSATVLPFPHTSPTQRLREDQSHSFTSPVWPLGAFGLDSCMGRGFPGGTSGKEPACQCRWHRDASLVPWSGRSPGGGHGNPLQYSCLKNLIDRGAWWVTGSQRVGHSWSNLACTHTRLGRGNLNYP